jgi:hypothetical protein
MVFKCAVCLDDHEDKSSKLPDTDTCASCGYDNSMSVTNDE